MKILQVNKFYYQRGGAERYFFDLINVLGKNGHEVIPLSMQDSRNESTPYQKYFVKKVDVEKIGIRNIIKFFHNYNAVSQLKKIIKEEKPDIAHLHNIAHQISPAIIKVLKKNNIPVIQTLHDYKLICPNYRLYSKNEVCMQCTGGKFYNCTLRKCMKDSYLKSFLATLEAYLNKNLYKQIDAFIAPSQFMKTVCVQAGVEEDKIKVIPNFVSPEFVSDLETNAGENYFFYYGRLSSEKGINILLEAAKKGDFNLKIAGVGPDYQVLKNEILKNGLEKRIELIGFKFGDELKRLIVNSKALILPSIWPENMPLNILESMSLGKLVIASRIGGIPEIVKDGVTGFLFEAGNTEDLLAQIEKTKQADLDAINQNAKRFVEKLDGEKYASELLAIYKKLIKEEKRSVRKGLLRK